MAFLIKLIYGDKINNSIGSINTITSSEARIDINKEVKSIFDKCGWKESDLLKGIKERAIKSILKGIIHPEKVSQLPNLLTAINTKRKADNVNKKYEPQEILDSADILEQQFPLFDSREIIFILKSDWRIKNQFNEKLKIGSDPCTVEYNCSEKEKKSIFDRIHAAMKRDCHKTPFYFERINTKIKLFQKIED